MKSLRIEFEADPSLAGHLPPPPKDISFDIPYGPYFADLNEGYFDLGAVPCAAELEKDTLKFNAEEHKIKGVGNSLFSVPAQWDLLVPTIKLVAAFEATRFSRFLQKGCSVTVRDYVHHTDSIPSDLHRDPPNPEIGEIQNTYTFASKLGAEFPNCPIPKPYHVIGFGMASPHRTPDIIVPNSKQPLRRLFVGITFNYRPSEQPTHISRFGSWVGQELSCKRK